MCVSRPEVRSARKTKRMDASANEEMASPPPRIPLALVALVVVVSSVAVASLFAFGDASSPSGARFGPDWILRVTRGASLAVVASRLWIAMRRHEPENLELMYDEGSWFSAKTIQLRGGGILVMFTNQSWVLLGVYFAVALGGGGSTLFGVVFASSHLVSSLSSWVLIPRAIEACRRNGTDVRRHPFFSPDVLCFHNLNVLLVHVDLFLSRRTMNAAHLGASALWAAWYVVFAWFHSRTALFVPYPFIDYTLPLRRCLPTHLGLVALLAFIHLLGVGLSRVLVEEKTHPALRAAAHLALLRSVTRFRPPSADQSIAKHD